MEETNLSMKKKIAISIVAAVAIVSVAFGASIAGTPSGLDRRAASGAEYGLLAIADDPGTGGTPSPESSSSVDSSAPSVTPEPPYASPPEPVDPLPTRITGDGKFYLGINMATGSWKSDYIPKNSPCVIKVWSDYSGNPDSLITTLQMRGGVIYIGMPSFPIANAPIPAKLFETYGCVGWTLKRAE